MTTEEQNSRPSEMHLQTPSPGKMLASARMSAGLSQEEVANELYMTVGKVKSLEADDFDRLHSDTFIRGYLRAYANLLKVDAEQVMAAYDERAKKLGLVTEFQPQPQEVSNRKVWQFAALLLSSLLLIWLISVWFFDNKKVPEYPPPKVESEQAAPSPDDAQNLPLEQQESSAAASVAAIQSAAEVAATSSTAAVNDEPAEQSSAVSEQVAPAIASDVSQAASGDLDELRFEFLDECWLEVSDASGDVLATELERAGANVVLKGHAPFNVKLGNAPGVKVYLNGQPVDVPDTRGTNVATLKIGQ